jgi:hypothetical protein
MGTSRFPDFVAVGIDRRIAEAGRYAERHWVGFLSHRHIGMHPLCIVSVPRTPPSDPGHFCHLRRVGPLSLAADYSLLSEGISRGDLADSSLLLLSQSHRSRSLQLAPKTGSSRLILRPRRHLQSYQCLQSPRPNPNSRRPLSVLRSFRIRARRSHQHPRRLIQARKLELSLVALAIHSWLLTPPHYFRRIRERGGPRSPLRNLRLPLSRQGDHRPPLVVTGLRHLLKRARLLHQSLPKAWR